MATHKDEQVTVRFFYSEHASDQDPLDPLDFGFLDPDPRSKIKRRKCENSALLN